MRVISATHVDLEEAVKEKKFRKIFICEFRLCLWKYLSGKVGVKMRILLRNLWNVTARSTVEVVSKTSSSFRKALLSYSWPGNVRELENKIQKSLIQAVRGVVSPQDLGLDNVTEQVKKSSRTLRRQNRLKNCNSSSPFWIVRGI